ncbi:hypothetical protein AMATHDRAFT_6148 [Amanita thiersii Skay4041]|uniref:CFEM domain-containing protein n=1 Tax=Amanita thiersii Skay4041 TaxID=703135 RepID=A0A2A9NID8_9AGAR|nr:hypothetical protein AMATHDRAFT_6148 [Amanita thiersii Skay4041]
MKPSFAFALLATSTIASAQLLVDWTVSLPQCAVDCAKAAANAVDVQCNVIDLECICRRDIFWTLFRNCVNNNCPFASTDPAYAPIINDRFHKLCPCVLGSTTG